MRMSLLMAAPLLALLIAGCSEDPGECPDYDLPPPLSELAGKSYVADPTCKVPDMQDQVGEIEMRIDPDGARLVLSYDRREADGRVVRVEETYDLDPLPGM